MSVQDERGYHTNYKASNTPVEYVGEGFEESRSPIFEELDRIKGLLIDNSEIIYILADRLTPILSLEKPIIESTATPTKEADIPIQLILRSYSETIIGSNIRLKKIIERLGV